MKKPENKQNWVATQKVISWRRPLDVVAVRVPVGLHRSLVCSSFDLSLECSLVLVLLAALIGHDVL